MTFQSNSLFTPFSSNVPTHSVSAYTNFHSVIPFPFSPINIHGNSISHPSVQQCLLQLQQASDQSRWILFIGQQSVINKQHLIEYGIDLNKVLFLKETKHHTHSELIEKALKFGNFSSIITHGQSALLLSFASRQAMIQHQTRVFFLNDLTISH